MASPFLAASPEGKVIDHRCSQTFGLLEIKCLYSKFYVGPSAARTDESFFAENANGKPRLRRGHHYYFQIQGQLGITGESWCHFITCTSKGVSIERILSSGQH